MTETLTWSDNFDSETNGDTPANWTKDAVYNFTTYFDIYNGWSYSSPNSMRLSSTSSHLLIVRHDVSGGFDGRVSMRLSLQSTVVSKSIVLMNTTGGYSGANVVLRVRFNFSGAIDWYDGSAYQSTGTNYTTGAHSFEIRPDYDAHTYDIYYDSVLIKSGATFISNVSKSYSIQFLISDNPTIYVDDVELYSLATATSTSSDAIELKTQLTWSDGTNTKTLNILNFDHDRKMNSAAELTFSISNKSGEYNYFFMPGAEIKFYYGKGALPDDPQFTGFVTEVSGTTQKEVTCVDYLGLLRYNYLKVDDYSNYDGYEITSAMADVITNTPGNQLTVAKTGTFPQQIISDADEFRYKKYEDRLTILSDMNDLAYDTSYSSSYDYHPLPYFFYVDGVTFYHIKQPYVDSTKPALTISYADNMIESSPEYTIDMVCNKCTYIGKEYEDSNGIKTNYEATYTDNSTSSLMRTFHVVEQDDTLESDGDCLTEAVRYVQEHKGITVRSTLKHTEGFDLIPGKSVIKISDSRYGLDGNYLVAGVHVTGGQGTLEATFELNKRKSVMTDFL